MFPTSSLAAVGSVPKARAVAFAMANNPRSHRGLLAFEVQLCLLWYGYENDF